MINVSVMEFEGLKNLETVIRVALVNPGTGEFIAGALQALDAVRREGANIPPHHICPGLLDTVAGVLIV